MKEIADHQVISNHPWCKEHGDKCINSKKTSVWEIRSWNRISIGWCHGRVNKGSHHRNKHGYPKWPHDSMGHGSLKNILVSLSWPDIWKKTIPMINQVTFISEGNNNHEDKRNDTRDGKQTNQNIKDSIGFSIKGSNINLFDFFFFSMFSS